MHIGIVALGNSKKDYFENSIGGYTYRISELIKYLTRRGIRVSLIGSEDDSRDFTGYLNKDFYRNQSAAKNYQEGRRFVINYLGKKLLMPILQKEKYSGMVQEMSTCDLIDFQNIRLAAPFLNRFSNTQKCIITQHYSVPYYYKKLNYSGRVSTYFLRKLEKKALRKVHGVICLTEEEYQFYKDYGVRNLIIIPTPVELSELQQQELTPDALFVASNMPANQEAARCILNQIAPQNSLVRFHMVGPISEFAQSQEVRSNVIIHGIVSKTELKRLYQNVTFVILPMSTGAGYSTKAIEALVYGKIVLGSENGLRGTGAVADQHFILCSTPGDYQIAFERLFQHPDRAKNISRQARLLAEQYSIDVVFQKYVTFLEQILES